MVDAENPEIGPHQFDHVKKQAYCARTSAEALDGVLGSLDKLSPVAPGTV
jgi:hypothetical protein